MGFSPWRSSARELSETPVYGIGSSVWIPFPTGFSLTRLLTFRASTDIILVSRCILHPTSRSLFASHSTPFRPNAAVETPGPVVEWTLAASNLFDPTMTIDKYA